MAIGGVGGVSQLASYVKAGNGATPLSQAQQQEVNRLKAIDAKVRAHEQAHMAVGAGLTGGASYQYARGPDGRQYAVAGEVSINVSDAATPQATIERARLIEAAALAPQDPSPQDRAVAAQAAMMASQARAELSKAKAEEGARPSVMQQAAGLRAYAAAASDEGDKAPRLDQYA